MGRVISFSEFDGYFANKQREADFYSGAIIDTNILISLTYELKSDHEEVFEFVSSLDKFKIPYFTTVTTRSEYLDFYRRLILTENLLSIVDGTSPLKITTRERSEIKTKEGLIGTRQSRKPGTDRVFNDADLKDIKRVFSAAPFSGHHGWLKVCSAILGGRLLLSENALKSFGVTYISQHDDAQKPLFTKKIDWPEARDISEMTGLGLSDSMILNALQCSRFPFVISADFDVGYAVLADPKMKDAVMPDSVASKFKNYNFVRRKKLGTH